MNLKCARCDRHLGKADVASGSVELVCPKCPGTSVYVFEDNAGDTQLRRRQFIERRRAGVSDSHLERKASRAPACNEPHRPV